METGLGVDLYSIHAALHRLDVGFAWERHTFSTKSFAIYHLEKPYYLKRVIFNVFEPSNESQKEYFAIPSDTWFHNLLLGCQAREMTVEESVRSHYTEPDASKIWTELLRGITNLCFTKAGYFSRTLLIPCN